jgi:hypothetical protein
MIVKNMSDSEILKELKTIDTILKSRISGHLKKFEKKLKSNAYKHNDVLEVREYVINWNKVLVCFQKLVHTDKLSSLSISHIVVTEDSGAFLLFEGERGSFFFHHFTNHAINRMRERTGLTLKDFFVNEFVGKAGASLFLIKYEEHGKTDFTYIMTIGECHFIVEIHGNRIDVVTDLDWDRLYLNQMTLFLDSKASAERIANKAYNKDAATLKGVGLKKTSDLVKAVFA